MSAGQTFGLLASDFGRALFSVGWGRYELLLIGYLMENSWGVVKTKRSRDEWPDPAPVQPNFYALSIQWKVPSQRLYEGRDALKAKGVVMESEEGLWINKDASTWVDPKTGAGLVAPAMLEYATEARSRKAPSDNQSSYTPQRGPISDPITRPSVEPFHGAACNGSTPQRGMIPRHSVESPIEERARGDSLDFKDNTPRQGARGSESVQDDTPDPSEPTIPPPVKNHPKDVTRVVTKCRELFELTGWDHMAKSACNEYPAAWVLEAIEAAAPARPSSWNYVAGVLRRFRENGGPDSARAPKANGWTPPARQPSPDWKPPNVND